MCMDTCLFCFGQFLWLTFAYVYWTLISPMACFSKVPKVFGPISGATIPLIGSFSNDNGDGNEDVTNLHIQWAKTIALHAPHVCFSYLSISLPSSAKQQREITKFEVLRRTSALGDKFSFFSPKFSAARNGFIPEGPPHLCHIKKLGIVAKWSQ